MTKLRILCLSLGALLLLTSPAAWCCDAVQMHGCQAVDCAMHTSQSTMPGCHGMDEPANEGRSLAPSAGACCQAPMEREPVESTIAAQLEASSAHLSEAKVERPAPGSESAAVAGCEARIASQRHEVGRYTLLSSFLI